MLALVATAMTTSALSAGFDRLYPLRVLTVGGALWFFRKAYAGWRWSGSTQAVFLGVLAFVLWMALEWAATPAGTGTGTAAAAAPATGRGANLPTELAQLSPIMAGAWIVCRIVGSVLIAPIAEELAFRGYLAPLLVTDEFESLPAGGLTWMSIAVSSIVFGSLHAGRWAAGTVAGLLYALALNRRGRLADAILAHATTNGLIAAYVLTTGSWSLWT
jgi:CAAX prenyl protease-like protein